MNASEQTAIGIFDTRDSATKAISKLRESGFTGEQIGVASNEVARHFAKVDATEQHKADAGAVNGSIVGSGLGAVLGLAGATLIPGAAPIVAGSLLLSALMGGAAGAAVGAFAGPFVAMGMSESDAQEHADLVKQGKTVVMVYAPDRREVAHDIMVKNGAYDDSMNTSP